MLNVILVNYNSSLDTINCIKSLLDSSNNNSIRVYVFDNASSEENKDILVKYQNCIEKNNKNIFFYYSKDNLGFAAANNFWMRSIANGEFIWILNNDTLVNIELLKKVYNNLPEDNEVLYFDCFDFNNNFHDTGLHYINLYTGRYHVRKKFKSDEEYICGASFIVKKTEKLPLWNEDYFLYFEDVDYSFALKKLKYRFIHLENCYFNHKISASSKKIRKINRIKLRSQIMFMKKYGKNNIIFFMVKIFILLIKFDFQSLQYFIKEFYEFRK